MRIRLLAADRRGATALEFALVSPVLILFMFGLVASYSLIGCRRAMDYGVETALRYAAVRAGTSTGTIVGVYQQAAGVLWSDVGLHSTVQVAGTYAVGSTITVTATYNWTFPGGVTGNSIFNPIRFTSSDTMRVVN